MMKLIKSSNALKALDEGCIEGYASVFGEVDSYGDTVAPEAYDKVIAEKQMPLMFYEHCSMGEVPIGKWSLMEKDERGLKIKGQLNLELKKAQEVYSAIKFGSLNGLSVAFSIQKNNYKELEDKQHHLIKEIDRLSEVSIVNFPADSFARISSVKSADDIKTIRDFEDHLRDLDISKSQAVALVAAAKRVFASQRDSVTVELTQAVERINALTQSLS